MAKYNVIPQDGIEEALIVPFHVQQAQDALDNPVADGLTWREAKKTLRKYYLDKAAALRKINEQTYFNK